eukprot:2561653-Rhodomonas_salina.3
MKVVGVRTQLVPIPVQIAVELIRPSAREVSASIRTCKTHSARQWWISTTHTAQAQPRTPTTHTVSDSSGLRRCTQSTTVPDIDKTYGQSQSQTSTTHTAKVSPRQRISDIGSGQHTGYLNDETLGQTIRDWIRRSDVASDDERLHEIIRHCARRSRHERI